MRLFIAEKSSVATHVVSAFGGNFRCYDDYFESATDIVSCCVTKINRSKPPNKAGELDSAEVAQHGHSAAAWKEKWRWPIY